VVGSCEHSNKPSGSIKCGKFLDHVNDYQLLKDYDLLIDIKYCFKGNLNE